MKPGFSEHAPIDRRLLEEQFPGGGHWQGSVPVETERLQAAGLRTEGALQWRASYEQGDLRLQVAGPVGLTCTRCLSDLSVPFSSERRFRLFDTAAEADAELSLEDSTEETLSTEDEASVLSLVEDELLLALEDLMVHAGCEVPQQPASNDLQRPFAGLATLLDQKDKD